MIVSQLIQKMIILILRDTEKNCFESDCYRTAPVQVRSVRMHLGLGRSSASKIRFDSEQPVEDISGCQSLFLQSYC